MKMDKKHSELGSQSVYIAMWSGPRNISTALLRAWENRWDTVVCDEPLYGQYLLKTKAPHPGTEKVVTCQETDWRKVVSWLSGPIPNGKRIFYQKHMAHHLLPEIERDWFPQFFHCILIRNPHEMLTSLLKIFPEPRLPDTAFPQQVDLFHYLKNTLGQAATIIDSRDILENPEWMLRALCSKIGVPFSKSMLHWPAGGRDTDGVWAKHWYSNVEKSTTFEPYRPREEVVPAPFTKLLQQCQNLYEELYEHRLTATNLHQ